MNLEVKKHTLPSLLSLDHAPTTKTPSKPSHHKPPSLLTPSAVSTKQSRNVSPLNTKTPAKTPANKSRSPKSRNVPITNNEDYPLISGRLKEMDNRTLRQVRQCLESRPLKKLYTAEMHQQYTGKLDELKRKYDYVYKYVVKDPQDIIDPNREKIKDVVLKSENLFNTTYSIKYFGMKDDQIGILSKRVNMNPKPAVRQNRTTDVSRRDLDDIRPSIQLDRTYQGAPDGFKRHNRTGINFSSPQNPSSSKNKLKNITQGLKDFGEKQERATSQEGTESLVSKIKGARRSLEVSVPGTEEDYFKNYSHNIYGMIPPQITESEHESLEGRMHTQAVSFGSKDVHHPEDQQEELSNHPGAGPSLNKGNEFSENNREDIGVLKTKSPDGYMITKYILPKKLQTPKKVERVGRKLTGLQKMVKAPEEDNYHHFERNLKSLNKVKRNMLRSLDVRAPPAEEYKDDLNAVEKFRTNELNNLMANVTRYSYAKLLETLANGPNGVEKEFEEKNKHLEEIFKSRKQKKITRTTDLNGSTGRISKGSSTLNGWHKDKIDEVEEMYANGDNFDLKLEYDDTELLTRYLKVRNAFK